MTDQQIISRAEAKAAGLKRYFTGEPCKRGHVAERYVLAGHCVECTYAAVAADIAADPEKKRKQRRARRAANPSKYQEKERAWKAANLEKAVTQIRVWKEKNREKIRAYNQTNRETIAAKRRARRAANIDEYREKRRREYAKAVCAKFSARVDKGLENAKASGTYLDPNTAIDLFKTHDNAFEFLE